MTCNILQRGLRCRRHNDATTLGKVAVLGLRVLNVLAFATVKKYAVQSVA